MTTPPKVTCPTCGKNDTWTPQNSFKPFCSDRCKLIDLGEWAGEKRRIPGEDADPNQPTDEENT